MSDLLRIRVQDDYPWNSAQVASEEFTKNVAVERERDRISAEIWNSPVLEITDRTGVVQAAPAPVVLTAPEAAATVRTDELTEKGALPAPTDLAAPDAPDDDAAADEDDGDDAADEDDDDDAPDKPARPRRSHKRKGK